MPDKYARNQDHRNEMTTSAIDINQTAINTIRTLSMDAVQQANSGHPGTPMALAPVAYSLWSNHFDLIRPIQAGFARDRFVLSCGHASMLLYSLLHLAGVAKTDDNGNPTDATCRFRWTTFEIFDNCTVPVPAIRNLATPPESKRRPDRSDRASATVSGWRLPENGWRQPTTDLILNCLDSTRTRFAAMATSWKASAAKPLHWPGI